ncbi:hypothetical protein T439DRAFT_330236 [Meredithblackwellia eburnea MCA 4105]
MPPQHAWAAPPPAGTASFTTLLNEDIQVDAVPAAIPAPVVAAPPPAPVVAPTAPPPIVDEQEPSPVVATPAPKAGGSGRGKRAAPAPLVEPDVEDTPATSGSRTSKRRAATAAIAAITSATADESASSDDDDDDDQLVDDGGDDSDDSTVKKPKSRKKPKVDDDADVAASLLTGAKPKKEKAPRKPRAPKAAPANYEGEDIDAEGEGDDDFLNPAGPPANAEVFVCPHDGCGKSYKGSNARSIWRRHLQDKHGVKLSDQPRRSRWDKDGSRPPPKDDDERRQRVLESKRKWARKSRAKEANGEEKEKKPRSSKGKAIAEPAPVTPVPAGGEDVDAEGDLVVDDAILALGLPGPSSTGNPATSEGEVSAALLAAANSAALV